MYSQGDIEDAVASGALAAEQAASFRDFVARRNDTPTVDEEYFRLLRGYNDIFVSYACVFVLIAAGWLGSMVPIGGRGGMGMIPSLPLVAALLVAAASWGLAELFVRRRRTALPGFILTFTFGFGVLLTLLAVVQPMMGSGEGAAVLAAIAAAIAAAATWGFWLRFRVPVSQMVALGLGVLAIILLIGSVIRGDGNVLSVITLLLGLGVFAYAMRVDLSDRWRVTERSDVAFWLHSLAAVLIVLPLMSLLGLSGGIGSAVSGIVMLILFLLLTLLGLAVARKVYVITAVTPLVYALNSLIQGNRMSAYGGDYDGGYGNPYGGGFGNPSSMIGGTFVTILIISVILLLLAIFWTPLRRMVLGILPAGLRARLAGTDATPIEQARPFE